MAFELPFYHQNTHVNITILVVDDDPTFLSIILNMLKNPSYKDKSFGEITVMTANDSSEAVSTLRGQCNNIDVVITDYHMPGLNGVQLKKRIDEEFGNLPVIVISADMNNEIEQETLSSGAMCFMRKPIKSNDLNTIWKHALHYKMNDGSRKIQETNSTSNPYDGDSRPPQATKKSKIKWTRALEDLFFKAIQHIGLHKATPKKILEYMNVNYLTRAHVASKLQKYRNFLKKVTEEGIERSRVAMNSNFASSSINPQHSYNYNTSQSNNNLFNSQLGYGLGQSSLMMYNNAGLHDSIHYMNRRPTYNLSQTGSNLLPMRGSLGFSNGVLPLNEERRSIFGTSQESQAPRFGQYGTPSDVLGMNSNLTTVTMGSNYAGIRINENGVLFGLGGVRVNGNGNGSLGGIRVHGTGTGNGSGSFDGIRVHGNGNGSLGGIRVHGTGNGSLGEKLSGMNCNFNNNNMSNHGCSTSRFPSAYEDQSQNNLIAQAHGVVPAVLENPSIFNDHHGIDEQHQGTMTTGENLGVSTAYPLEDIGNWSFNNGNYNDETLNSIAANSEMCFPTEDMNITYQEHGGMDLTELPLSFDEDWDDEDFMNYLVDDDMN